MKDPLVPLGDGHTELSDEDRLGLIPTYIATRSELFDAEQRNIAQAMLGRSPSLTMLLDDAYLRRLHRAMFSQVWEWAGRYRIRETNIGVAFEQIPSQARSLVDDTRAWIENSTYGPDEIAVRFHHRLVAIHAFPNGNGRHGRIAADYLIGTLDGSRFTWGALLGVDTETLRSGYVRALRHADDGEIDELLTFSRS